MAFYDDLVFPESISVSRLGGSLNRLTELGVTQAGYEQRAVVWEDALRRWEAGLVPRLASEWEQVCALWEIVEARGHGFRLLDPSDFQVLAGQGALNAVDAQGQLVGLPGGGYGMPALQAVKRYSVGSRSYYRRLPKLIAGTLAGSRNGVPLVVGSGAGQVAIDVDTGRIAFVADDTRSVVAVTVGATTQVQLSAALAGAVLGDRVYLAALGGAGAALVNGLSHAITSIAGTTYTLGVDTTGATITPAGTAALYPQADEVLEFTAQFHVPVRFDADELTWSAVAGGDEILVEPGSTPLRELRLELAP